MPLSDSQRAELVEYLDTILELYDESEYEELVEDIVSNYCQRKFGLNSEKAIKLFYEIVDESN